MSTAKRIAIAACGLVIVLIAILLAMLLLVDPNSYKGQLAKFVGDRTGRPLELRGPLKLSLLPSIALNVTGVSLGNPPGFTGEPLVVVEQARVGMKLWPLLHHRFEVGQIELIGLRLHLLRNAQGTGNWGARSGAAPPAPTPAAASSSFPLTSTTIEGIQLRDAEVTYDDPSSMSHWRVQKLSATVGAIDSGRQVPLNLQATIDNGAADRSATVTIKARLQARSDAPAIDLDSLTIDATLSDKSLPGGGAPVTLTVPHLRYASTQSNLDLPAFTLASQGLQLSGSLSARQVSSVPVLSGSLELRAGNLRSWLGKVGIGAPLTRDPLALSNVSGRIVYAMNDNGVSIKPLQLVLDGSRIDGELLLPKAAGAPMAFQVRVDSIDIDRYLSPSSSGPAAKGPKSQSASELPTASLRALALHGVLQVKAAKVAGMSIADLDVNLDAHDGDLTAKPIEAQVYGGSYRGAAGFDVRGSTPKLRADAALAGIDVGALLNAVNGSRRLSGRANLNAQLTAEGQGLDAWLKSLSGRLDATVTNGALEGIDVEYAIAQAVALIGQHTPTSRPDTRRTPFSQLYVKNRITAGVMTTESLTAETSLLKVAGQGTFALVSTATDYHLAASLLKQPDARSPGGLANLAGATVPFTLSGPVDKLSIRPDVEGLVKGQLKQKLEQKTQDFAKGLLDKLKGPR